MILNLYFTIDNQKKEYRHKIDDSKISWFIEKLIKSKNYLLIDFSKVWFFDQTEQLYSFYDFRNKKYKLISDLEFTNPNKFNILKLLSDKKKNIIYKFAVSSWGNILYLNYPYFDNGNKSDINKFFEIFDYKEIQLFTQSAFVRRTDFDFELIVKFFGEDFLNQENIENEDDLENLGDWIQEGMPIDGHCYLNKFVYDNLLGTYFKLLEKPLTIYRTWSDNSQKEDSWISTSLKDFPYFLGDKLKFEKYILPKGFPVCYTEINGKSYADEDEIIVRSKDLQLL